MNRLRPKVPLGQLIKGKVSKVNTCLLYFEVEERFRVYVDTTSTNVSLPRLNDNVEIVNPQKFNRSTNTAVMGPCTIYKFPINCTDINNESVHLGFLKDSNVAQDVDEVIALDLIIRKLESFLTNNAVQLCIIILYHLVLSIVTDSMGCQNFKKSFKLIKIKSPKDLQYTNLNSQLYTFLNFDGQCMFNVYPSEALEKVTDNIWECLFGILAVSNTHGYYTLRDEASEILVKFAAPCDGLYKFHNCLVMIKKYTVFSEIYLDCSQPTLCYLLTKAEDVVVMPEIEKGKPKLFYGINESWNISLKYSFFLQTSKISEVIYGYDNSPECWIEALVSMQEDFLQSKKAYAILSNELLELVPFLQEQVVYKVFTNQKLKFGNLASYKELYSMREAKKVIVLNSDSVFQETNLPGSSGVTNIVLEDFHEIKSYISNLTDYTTFSFIMKIEKKVLQPITYSSWFPKRHKNVRYFGDIEKHQARLQFRDAPSNSYIDLYLTNRENHVMPLGLIANMKVKIKHVQVNKKKYLKATVFTGFEIVEYCPEIRFASANLFFRNRCTWQWRTKTARTLLGMYTRIPANCIVHGTVLFRALLDLRLSTVCAKCREVLPDNHCRTCNTEQKDVAVFMVVQAQDSINPSFHLEIENIYFLLELVGLRNEKGVEAFFEECIQWGMVDINFLKIPEEYRIINSDSNPVLQKLVTLIRKQINYQFYFLMDVVCIKQFAEGRKPWKIVEYEFTS